MKIAQQSYVSSVATTPKPIVFWASLGALFLALTVYVFGAWMLSPDFTRTYPPVPLDDTVKTLVFWNQLVFSLITVICLVYWVVLPKIRTGQFSFMGLLV